MIFRVHIHLLLMAFVLNKRIFIFILADIRYIKQQPNNNARKQFKFTNKVFITSSNHFRSDFQYRGCPFLIVDLPSSNHFEHHSNCTLSSFICACVCALFDQCFILFVINLPPLDLVVFIKEKEKKKKEQFPPVYFLLLVDVRMCSLSVHTETYGKGYVCFSLFFFRDRIS